MNKIHTSIHNIMLATLTTLGNRFVRVYHEQIDVTGNLFMC